MNQKAINTKEELLARTLTMLSETVERYDLFADQMEVANNPEAAKIFQWLSARQSQRTETVQALSEGLHLPHIEPWNYDWDDAINIDMPGNAGAHYMMTPHHTLGFAMQVEHSAADFFKRVKDNASLPELKKLAQGFAAEAMDFFAELEEEREKQPIPEEGWDEDPDPPLLLE